jgi:hypothetical protein
VRGPPTEAQPSQASLVGDPKKKKKKKRLRRKGMKQIKIKI